MSDSVFRAVDAPPEVIWKIITDITRIPEWSPECVRCEWVEGDSAVPGATFRGTNRRYGAEWTTIATVERAEANKDFTFVTDKGSNRSTRWQYRIDATNEGTLLTERYEYLSIRPWVKFLFVLFNRSGTMKENLRQSLDKIAEIAEREAGSPISFRRP